MPFIQTTQRSESSINGGFCAIGIELLMIGALVGDVVVLPTMGFTKLPYNKEDYYVGPENQVLAKINNE